jgi:signal transduction histidine kinase
VTNQEPRVRPDTNERHDPRHGEAVAAEHGRADNARRRPVAARQAGQHATTERARAAHYSVAGLHTAIAQRHEPVETIRLQVDRRRRRGEQVTDAEDAFNADALRRRIAGDLHDGAQQRLVAVRVRLAQVVELIGSDPARAVAMIEELGGDVEDALDELRALVHGIYPHVLAFGGLRDALTAAAQRAPIPARVIARDVGRYPEAIENAVYFTCAEALQNTLKHAPGATAITLTLTEHDNRLEFDVHDDGPGIADDARPGTGFASMHHRIAATGGQLTVLATPDAGTHVHGTVPLHDPKDRTIITHPDGARHRA